MQLAMHSSGTIVPFKSRLLSILGFVHQAQGYVTLILWVIQEMEQKCDFVCENSSLTVTAFIPSVSFIAGHHIPVTVSVAKGYSQTVRSIGIKLIQLEKNRSRQTKLSRVKWKDFISPGDVTYEMDLLIPKNTTPKSSKEGSPRRYEVQVSVKIAHSNCCRLCLPVRIEAVGPIRGRILEADNDVLIPMFAFK